MFNPHAITLTNFKSYVGEHEFVFPTEPGLYYLTGLNKAEPRLGSNGAGKSTLLDAIYWCLFGKTLRGLRGSDVISHDCKTASVKLDITIRDERIIICRAQAPNKLTLNDEIVDQGRINGLLGLTDESFIYSVMYPQFGQTFFELKPSEKLNLFTEIMNLNDWLELSEKALKKSIEIETEIKMLKQRIELSTSLLLSVEQDLVNLKAKEASFDIDQKHKQHKLAREIDELEIQILDHRDGIEDADHKIKDLTSELDKRQDSVNSQRNRNEQYIKKLSALVHDKGLIQAKIDTYSVQFSELRKLKSACPTCHQKVDTKHLMDEKHRIREALAKEKQVLDGLLKDIVCTERWAVSTSNNLQQVLESVSATKAMIEKLVAQRSRLKFEIEGCEKQIKQIEDQITDAPKNPYTEMVAEREQSIAATSTKVMQYKAALAANEADFDANFFWVAGFKRLRLMLIEDTLQGLEVEINNSLAELGLTDWEINLDVERENKSGGITKGFTVTVRNSSAADAIKWESWSGGEAQRLKLAGSLGLANLIMLQAGLVNTIEFYDEPSGHLDAEGLRDLAMAFNTRAIAEGKRIIVADHNIPEADCAGVIQVIKDSSGSRFA